MHSKLLLIVFVCVSLFVLALVVPWILVRERDWRLKSPPYVFREDR